MPIISTPSELDVTSAVQLRTALSSAGGQGAIGILGNQIVARYKLVVGRRINSATLIADARHSWLDALSLAGAMTGLIAVALGQPWGDPVSGR